MAIPVLSQIGRGLLAAGRGIGGAIDNAASIGLLDPNGMPPSPEDRKRMRGSWLMNVGGALAAGGQPVQGVQAYQQSELLRYMQGQQQREQERKAMIDALIQAETEKIAGMPAEQQVVALRNLGTRLMGSAPDRAKAILSVAKDMAPEKDEVMGQPFRMTGPDGQMKTFQQFKSGKISEVQGLAIPGKVEWRNRGDIDQLVDDTGQILAEAPIGISPAEKIRIEQEALRIAQAHQAQMHSQKIAEGNLGVSRGNLSLAQTKEQREAAQANQPKPISAEAAAKLAVGQSLIRDLDLIDKAFQEQGVGSSMMGMLTGTNQELSAAYDRASDSIGRLRSGGAINKDEEARFRRFLASWRAALANNPTAARNNLNQLRQEAMTVVGAIQGATAQQPAAVPQVGATFNGARVKSVTRIE